MRVGALVKWKHEDPFWVSLGTVVELRHSDNAEKERQFRVVWRMLKITKAYGMTP